MVAKEENHSLKASLRNAFRAGSPFLEFPREGHSSSLKEGLHFGHSQKAKDYQIKVGITF